MWSYLGLFISGSLWACSEVYCRPGLSSLLPQAPKAGPPFSCLCFPLNIMEMQIGDHPGTDDQLNFCGTCLGVSLRPPDSSWLQAVCVPQEILTFSFLLQKPPHEGCLPFTMLYLVSFSLTFLSSWHHTQHATSRLSLTPDLSNRMI